jgi:DNA-directed RNA polymerase specialized sigma54-like protein
MLGMIYWIFLHWTYHKVNIERHIRIKVNIYPSQMIGTLPIKSIYFYGIGKSINSSSSSTIVSEWVSEWVSELVSEWLLSNANSAIFQLYHGENKLIFNEMMIKSALY